MLATPICTIEEMIADAGELAVLPQVALRVLELTGGAQAGTADLERAISTDPALAAKVLTLANSAYYGMPRQVSSLREALMFLGCGPVRTLAAEQTTFAGYLGKSDADALARRAVWHHSLNTALCARTLAAMLPPSVQEAFTADQAFTGGLLHDIGKMALDQSRPALFLAIGRQAELKSIPFQEAEHTLLPFGHGLLGGVLAQRWNLPPALCEIIAFHHTPRAAQVNPRLTAVVSLANEMAHALDDTSDAPPSNALADRALEMLPPLRLSADALPTLLAACRRERDTSWTHWFMS